MERLNPEAAALFACLAAPRRRGRLIALLVTYQLVYDYLDAVNEDDGNTALGNGLQLHRALTDAVRPGRPPHDHYLHNSQQDDGAYTRDLAGGAAELVGTFAGAESIAPVLELATERCGQAQAHNHAAVTEQHDLRRWCARHAADRDYLWWETAAAGISCLGIHALLALIAEPESTLAAATSVDNAYFPGLCAISALLDSLVDHHSDQGTPNHSFTAHYRNIDEASDRLIAITRQTIGRMSSLSRGPRHMFILTGVLAFYLSSPALHPKFSRPVAENLLGAAWPTARAMRAAMMLRRSFQ